MKGPKVIVLAAMRFARTVRAAKTPIAISTPYLVARTAQTVTMARVAAAQNKGMKSMNNLPHFPSDPARAK
jgi:hypothetical protein